LGLFQTYFVKKAFWITNWECSDEKKSRKKHQKWAQKAGTYLSGLGKDFVILCLVVFDQKATVLERFPSVQSEPMILGVVIFSPKSVKIKSNKH